MSTYEGRKQLFDNIKILSKTEQEELFRILKKTKENYTENSNGIFFDLMLVSEECFQQMNEYMSFCLNNRVEHEQRLKEIETLRNEKYVSESDSDSDSD
jgi:hypothetical protein